ncbi:MAG TPA: DUF3298 domain-containing protein [Candidatus Eremiobacteraeota bacterium]|nr:DUF3298 domain-containing protein [Candidatus Eremiobacteraeota bacterium]
MSKDKETEETIKLKDNKVISYSLKYSYPLLDSYKNKDIQDEFNKEITSLVEEQVNSFKKDMAETEYFKSEFKSSFILESTIINKVDDLISIKFLTEVYYAGAAHPSHDIWTLNYDLKTGKTINLKDLFMENSDYLKVISDYSIKELSDKAGKDAKEQGYEPDYDWIKEGAGPKEENFRSFNLTDEGLIINFNEYQVACYAEGPKEVIIPYSKLKDIIKPEGPGGIYLK